jgi:uncharacterized membrane protein
MGKGRMEAFSDGVIAIIITIMVLEMRPPHGTDLADLGPLIPVFLSYVLSFIYVGIYWNNHHHMLAAARSVSGPILWANLHQLFWLSLIPFVTAWMGENHEANLPVAIYGVVLLMNAIAFFLLARLMVAHDGPDSALAKAMGRDFKGAISAVVYAVAIVVALVWRPEAAKALYVVVAMIWFIPDRRVERVLKAGDGAG